jgi:hypothetical protein
MTTVAIHDCCSPRTDDALRVAPVNDPWRFCFGWNDGTEDLELVDEHP